MAQFIIPKIEEIIEQRQNKIDSYLEKADQVRKQAENSLKHYDQVLNEAKNQSLVLEKNQKQEMDLFVEQQKNDLQKEIEQELAETEYILAKERLDTINAIDKISLKTALLVLKKIGLEEDLTEEDLKPFLYKENKV